MAEIHWANTVDGSFTNASYWIGGVAPSAADAAVLDAAGATPYTVTVSTTGTVAGIQTAANATLEVSGVRFEVTAGTDAGVNAGALSVIAGGYVELQGPVVNSGAIEVSGSISKTTLDLVNANLNGGGVISLGDYAGNQIVGGVVTNFNNTIEGAGVVGVGQFTNASAGVIDATSANVVLELTALFFDNKGLVESTGSAGMLINSRDSTDINTGTIQANGSGVLAIYQTQIANYGGEITAAKGSTLDIYGLSGIFGGTIDIAAGATLIVGESPTGFDLARIYNSDFENAGLVAVSSYRALVIEGGITNTGTVSLNASGHFCYLDVIDDLTLTGSGVVSLSDDSGNAITNSPPGSTPSAATFTNVDNTIAGAGTIGDAALSVFNDAEGVIDATGTISSLEIEIGASFANAGLIETTGPAGMLIVNGTTSGSGTIVNTGSIEARGAGGLTIEASVEGGAVGVAKGGTLVLGTGGTLAGAGILSLVNGVAAFGAGSDLAFADVTMSGDAATATFATSNLVYAGIWTQSGGTVSASTGERVNFTGSGDTFSGTIGGAGTVAFTGGSDTLDDVHITAANPVINGATVTLSGVIDLSGTMGVTTKDLVIAAGGASLGGGGSLVLSNLATNTVSGGTLTNVNDYIKGAGQLGDGSMALVNDAGGIIDGDDTVALTINTGASTIANAGIIEATSKGTTAISSAVDNTGVLAAFGGTLTVEGAVTGTGEVEIDGGLADLVGTFTQKVAFLGVGGGTLELAHSEDYTGEITGFSRTGATALELADIPFVSGTTSWSYTGTTTSGVLTVKDGTRVAEITLEGNYTRSTFTLSSDGHSGTTVVDPARTAVATAATVHKFITAMADFVPSTGGLMSVADTLQSGARILASPRAVA